MSTHVVTEDAVWPTSTGGGAVDSVNGQTGDVILNAEDVGADPAGSAAAAVPLTQKGAASGVATLDSGGDVPVSQLGNVSALGSGAVSSVNGEVGEVALELHDVIGGFVRIDPTETTATNASTNLTVVTPDGSGQVIEPAIEYVPGGWNGHKFWANITGYTNSDAQTENPAIYYSDDGITFTPVPGVPFPLANPPASGNNGDPNIVLGPDGVMHTIWLEVVPTFHRIKWSSSTDGVTWSTPTTILQSNSAGETLQAAVILFDTANDRWVMWSGDFRPATAVIKRRTCAVGASPNGAWSLGSSCTINNAPATRLVPWEKNIQKRGDQLHMITTMAANSGGGNTALYFAVSDDFGVTWNMNQDPLLVAAASGWDAGTMYRADFVPVDNGGSGLYGMWYSAKSAAGVWRMGYTTVKVT